MQSQGIQPVLSQPIMSPIQPMSQPIMIQQTPQPLIQPMSTPMTQPLPSYEDRERDERIRQEQIEREIQV